MIAGSQHFSGFLWAPPCFLRPAFGRASAVWLCFSSLASIQQRAPLIMHSGDTFLRIAGFFLMFAPAGAALSLDRLIRVRRGREDAVIRPRAPWAQRMIQFELALLYFTSFWWKMKGDTWLHGTALYYVIHLPSIVRFPIPGWIRYPAILKIGSWLALALEFSLGVLIWFRPLPLSIAAAWASLPLVS